MLEIRLLGAIEVRVGGQVVEVGPARQRAVLAALAVDAGQPVSVDTIIDRVWDERLPQRVRHAVYVYVARLRQILAAATAQQAPLDRRSGGYVLEVEPAAVDLLRVGQLMALAGSAASHRDAAALLREALGLWRGTPLSGVDGDWADGMRRRAASERLDAAIQWAAAEIRAGDPAVTVQPLTELAGEHPLMEPLIAAQVRALHLTGRSAEALDCWARARRRLAEELGTDPGPELRALHQQILAGSRSSVPRTVRPRSGPAQLPANIASFAGRDAALDRLDTLASPGTSASPVVISAVSGTAGVGKTTLAVHWAHRMAGQFPDGQLYVNLRGYDAANAVMTAAEALRGFLTALDVAPQKVPADVPAQAALYRTQLSGRRMLILLDNARDAEQVRPLLPATPGCVALVTSRSQLIGLVATEGARLLNLDLLNNAEAWQLLARRLGADRVAAEPEAVDRIIAACSRLPLALAIAAARALTQPERSLAQLADELAHARLDALTIGDPAADARAVFSWSYQSLSASAARLFRLLGLHPGPDFAVHSVASLAGVPLHEATVLLGELTAAQLLSERGRDRFGFHDLLRAYARELTDEEDAGAPQQAALGRLYDHYVHHAQEATTSISPQGLHPASPLTPGAGVTVVALAERDRAHEWYTDERPSIAAVVRDAAERRFDVHAWRLAHALSTFLDRDGLWNEWADTAAVGIAAADRLGDQVARAFHLGSYGRAQGRLGNLDDAARLLREALALQHSAGNRRGVAVSELDLAWLASLDGDYARSLGHGRRALDAYTAEGDKAGQVKALNTTGWCHMELGLYEAAVNCCKRAVEISGEIGYPRGQALALDTLGVAYHKAGDYRQAVECCSGAVEYLSRNGERYLAAACLTHVAESQEAAGDLAAARASYASSLATFEQLDHPDAAEARRKLRALDAV